MRATWSGWAVGALALVLMQGLAGGQAVTETSATEATVLYVAVDGNDAWSGTLAESNADASDGPLATPTGACDRVRVLRAEGAAGPVRVLFRGGVYRVTEALVLSPEDGGSREAPVTYAACPGEDVVISGGRPITGWKQEDDLWTVELPDVKSGAWRFSALWVNGEYRAPARTPNEGYLYTAGKAAPLKDATTGEETDRAKTAFKFNPGDIRHWDNLEDAIVVVMHSWDTSHHRIASIDDDTNTVNFTGPTGWAFEHWGPKQRYYVEHMFEALDSPGEWYLNRKTGVLYYWPKEGEDMATTEVVAPVSHQLLVFAGDTENGAFVDHVTVEGLSFHHTEQTLGPQGQPTAQAAYPVHGAVEANGARYCEMLNCEVAHTSNYAVWLQKGCQHNRFVRNHFHDLGAGGIRVGVGGDPANNHEVTGHNLVDNNWIHDGGTIWPAAVGVKIARSSYNTVSHNEISDFYYTGVSVGWSWGYTPSSAHHNVIEYNHIHHLGDRKLSDMGGIYCLGDAPGTVLRYNLIHDVFSYSYGGWGIYPDEGSTDLLITNNIAYNCKTGGFHQHYGRDNRIVNNVFAFSHQGQIMRTREEDHISFYFTKNIVYFNNGELLGSNWNNGNFRLDRNCYWDTSGEVEFKGRTLEEWQATGQDQHSIIANPLFANAEACDFRLSPDSPAVKQLGFNPIDTSAIGLYGDPQWADAPKRIPREPSELPTVQDPEPVVDDFESTEVGDPPAGAHVSGETDKATIRVTDEVAATGSRCLKITDVAGLPQAFNPHMFYTPRFRQGMARASFDLRVEPGAIIYHEWRDGGHPYHVGPSIHVGGDGLLRANDQDVTTLPHGEWVHIEVACGLGRARTGTYSLTVTVPGKDPIRVDSINVGSDRFRRSDWAGFVADGNVDAVMYLDNLRIAVE